MSVAGVRARGVRAVAVCAWVWGAVGACAGAHGQLVAEREFCGVGGTIPVRVERPRDEAAEPLPAPLLAPLAVLEETEGGEAGRLEVELVRAQTGEVIGRGEVGEGGLNLAALFPELWSGKEATLPAGVMYAQLRADGRRVGAPLVLTPMLTPPAVAPRVDRAGFPMFPAAEKRTAVFGGVRVAALRHLVLETTKGELEFALRPDCAPSTVWHFSRLVEGGMYTDVAFHKIASLRAGAEPDFVQSGDPTGTGLGGAGFLIDLEESPLRHEFGVISMARTPSEPNTASSQFFICMGGPGAASLDGKYAAFGRLVRGADVLRMIAASPVGPDNRPLDPPRVWKARLVDAPALGEGPPAAKDPMGERPER